MVCAWTMPVEAMGSKAFLAMDTGYLWDGYFGVLLLLMLRAIYQDERLLRHVDGQYPEQGKVIRSYAWQMYPWSVGRKLLRALIREESVGDPELAPGTKSKR